MLLAALFFNFHSNVQITWTFLKTKLIVEVACNCEGVKLHTIDCAATHRITFQQKGRIIKLLTANYFRITLLAIMQMLLGKIILSELLTVLINKDQLISIKSYVL